MSELGDVPTAEEFQRLEQAIKDLRQELELVHHQQAHLQMQISALTEANNQSRIIPRLSGSFFRPILIPIVKRNPFLYKLATRARWFLQR